MANVATFLLMLAIARGVHAYMENPAGSMIFSYLKEHLQPLDCLLRTSTANRCHYSDEPMGERYFKPYKFVATGAWIRGVSGRCECNPRKHRLLMQADGHGRVSGTPALRESQAYPKRLGIALLEAWAAAVPLEHLADTPAVPSRRAGVSSQELATRQGQHASQSSHTGLALPTCRAHLSSALQMPASAPMSSDESSGPWVGDAADGFSSPDMSDSDSSSAPSSGPWAGE